ncbi:MAG: glycosyltransferase family 2 protein [Anaerolineales bacterium]|jgi:glycosyltransferase involved in cell wall biosynthesis
MICKKKVIVVMPAYNAARTLLKTYQEIPHALVDEVILVDDCSQDHTVEISRQLGIQTILHSKNSGYGANQKTCYEAAMNAGADIVVMLHPDYQYTPKLITSMVSLIAEGIFDCVLGSRILGVGAIKGGMPRYKYYSNRLLTMSENILLNYKLSEYHTGYRAFSREILETLPFKDNSDDFVFDAEMLAQIIYAGYSIGEIACPTRYLPDSSSINFINSIRYGLGVLKVSLAFRLSRWNIIMDRRFSSLDPR